MLKSDYLGREQVALTLPASPMMGSQQRRHGAAPGSRSACRFNAVLQPKIFRFSELSGLARF